jgi:cytochrome c5
MSAQTVFIASATLAAAALIFAVRSAAQESEPGERIMNASCVNACHSVRVIQTQALTAEAWSKTVATMIEMGASVPKADVPVLVEYLAQHYAPVPEGRGKQILLDICTMCHDLGRIRLGRRSPEEWEETLVSMLNEGAPLSEEAFPVIHAYLSEHFGIE